jgi:hypothetical protein
MARLRLFASAREAARSTQCKANLRHPDETKFSDFIDRVIGHSNKLTWQSSSGESSAATCC